MKTQNQIQKDTKRIRIFSQPELQPRKMGRPPLTDGALIMLTEIYNRLDEKKFCDAIADFEGLADLMRGNPDASGVVESIDRMTAAELELNNLRQIVRKI